MVIIMVIISVSNHQTIPVYFVTISVINHLRVNTILYREKTQLYFRFATRFLIYFTFFTLDLEALSFNKKKYCTSGKYCISRIRPQSQFNPIT